jgi:uncharacterized protein (DUF1697 family)
MIKKYIAFLRGINVGNIRIKMTDLQKSFEDLGFQEVKTYLQTGNVVFLTEEKQEDIKVVLEKKLTQTFHYEAFVLIYAFDDLSDIIEKYPFERVETHHDYVIFIQDKAVLEDLKKISESNSQENQWVAEGQNVLYWKVKRSETLTTAFSKILSKAKYKSSTTVRNVNTLEKMV